jgi:hypothetical protein
MSSSKFTNSLVILLMSCVSDRSGTPQLRGLVGGARSIADSAGLRVFEKATPKGHNAKMQMQTANPPSETFVGRGKEFRILNIELDHW